MSFRLSCIKRRNGKERAHLQANQASQAVEWVLLADGTSFADTFVEPFSEGVADPVDCFCVSSDFRRFHGCQIKHATIARVVKVKSPARDRGAFLGRIEF